MNEILNELVTEVNKSLSFLNISKRGGLKRLITINYDYIENALNLISLGELIKLLNDKCDIVIEYNYCSRVLNQLRSSHTNLNTEKKYTTQKEILSISEKKPSTEPLQKGDNVESKKLNSFEKFKNLNRISLNLIDKYGIDLETLKSLGVMTIQDRTIMEGKIKTYCQSIDSQNLKNEYSHILKKDN
ncbi:TPA: hypothetical protein SMT61_003565 [Proteus mirabilis]|uniref:hypothetical protein n=1 Tax=Proteus mirabilis TaxID=584 RepID=UPI0029E15DC8|nr:hypothetical protein [Proteus mirabilis]HEK2780557.1 hypothetical protein [Proteus mirabilis]